jgi:hypothetical protein
VEPSSAWSFQPGSPARSRSRVMYPPFKPGGHGDAASIAKARRRNPPRAGLPGRASKSGGPACQDHHRPNEAQGIQLGPDLPARLPPPGSSRGVYPPFTAPALTIWNDTLPDAATLAPAAGFSWHLQAV